MTDGVGIEVQYETPSPHDPPPTTAKQIFTSVRGAADLVFGLRYAESYGAPHTFFVSLSNPLYV